MTRPPLLCYRSGIKSGDRGKSVKILNFALALAFTAMAAPAIAQLTSPSYEFLKAVRGRDGGKATELLKTSPPGLINFRDDDGSTPLLIAINRADPEWTAFLVQHGADVNLASKAGDTPLIAAARIGFQEAVEWLLTEGAKVDGANRMGETALITAVQQRKPQIVRALLNAGADPDRTDSAAGLSARDYALRDTRSRQILQLIEAKKPKAGAAASR